jgi:hypothetical protein
MVQNKEIPFVQQDFSFMIIAGNMARERSAMKRKIRGLYYIAA